MLFLFSHYDGTISIRGLLILLYVALRFRSFHIISKVSLILSTGYPIVNDPLYNHSVFGPEKGKGGRIGKSDEELISQLISIHNAENWLGIEGDDSGGSAGDFFGPSVPAHAVLAPAIPERMERDLVVPVDNNNSTNGETMSPPAMENNNNKGNYFGMKLFNIFLCCLLYENLV